MQRDELLGTTLGNYRILAPLGQGGMARVYRAYQESLEREVAIKVLPPWYAADRNFVERFNLEARLVARLSHPNIVTVHDASEQAGHLYIVMQLINGGTLKHRFDALHQQGRVMEANEVIPIFVQLAHALNYANEQGVVHRDVKPVNVLMDRSGRPILSDFGIAKVLMSTKDHLTNPGAGVGTPEYMSPEQCMGGPVDGRADIYALGALLFEAVTGQTPFLGENYPALAHSHVYEAPPRPTFLNPGLSPQLEQIILTALMKDPNQRYQRANDMAEALELSQQRSPTGNHAVVYRQPFAAQDQRMASPQPPVGPSFVLSTPQQPDLYSCPHCHQWNKAVRFCTRCGSPMNRCETCGIQNPANNRFCTRCGSQLTRGTN